MCCMNVTLQMLDNMKFIINKNSFGKLKTSLNFAAEKKKE